MLWGREGRKRTKTGYREETAIQEKKVGEASPHREETHSQPCAGEDPILSTPSPMEWGPAGPGDGRDEKGKPIYLHSLCGTAGTEQGHLPPILRCSNFLSPLRDNT